MIYNEQWAERWRDHLVKQTERKVAKAYKTAIESTKTDLGKLFEKYADDKVLTYAEMAKYNRLNSLQRTLIEDLKEPWREVEKDMRALVGDAYQDSYYQHGFMLSRDVGINLSFGLVDRATISALYNEPNLSGLSLKETLSRTRYNLLIKERQSLVQGFLKGDSYQTMARDIRDVFNKSFKDALRIVRTEGGRASSEGQLKSYDDAEDMGIEMDRIWLATLDSKTRDSHPALDGQKADKEGYFHYRGEKTKAPRLWGIASEDIDCRCSTIAKPRDVEYKVRRSNIGNKDIIEYETYVEWKKDQK